MSPVCIQVSTILSDVGVLTAFIAIQHGSNTCGRQEFLCWRQRPYYSPPINQMSPQDLFCRGTPRPRTCNSAVQTVVRYRRRNRPLTSNQRRPKICYVVGTDGTRMLRTCAECSPVPTTLRRRTNDVLYRRRILSNERCPRLVLLLEDAGRGHVERCARA